MNGNKTDARTLLEASGFRIAPFRLARIADIANRIVKLILCDSVCAFTLEEARLILKLASSVLDEGENEWS